MTMDHLLRFPGSDDWTMIAAGTQTEAAEILVAQHITPEMMGTTVAVEVYIYEDKDGKDVTITTDVEVSEFTARRAHEARLSREDACDWYEGYSRVVVEEDGLTLTLDDMPFWMLDETDDDAVVAALRAERAGLSEDHARALVEVGREIRNDAEYICAEIDRAIDLYVEGDIAGCCRALENAESWEAKHGDTPATNEVAEALGIDFIGGCACPAQSPKVGAR